MSVTAKAFFISAVAISATTVWGVHYLQKWEYDVSLKFLPFITFKMLYKGANIVQRLEHVPRDFER